MHLQEVRTAAMMYVPPGLHPLRLADVHLVCNRNVQGHIRLCGMAKRELCPQRCQGPDENAQDCRTSWTRNYVHAVYLRQHLILRVRMPRILPIITLKCHPIQRILKGRHSRVWYDCRFLILQERFWDPGTKSANGVRGTKVRPPRYLSSLEFRGECAKQCVGVSNSQNMSKISIYRILFTCQCPQGKYPILDIQ
jgi:hypothetical protein